MKPFVLVTIATTAALGTACTEIAPTDVSSHGALDVEPCDPWVVDAPIIMWPPNHAMRRYSLEDCVSVAECPPPPGGTCGDGVLDPGEECDDGNDNPFDGCDTCIIVDTTPDVAPPAQASVTGLSITSITSNEPIDGTGDGHTNGDTVIVDATTFELRAERDGHGGGRSYRVNFIDAHGESGACTFVVPHDLGTL
jgi:cysteine-rich repeat protein